MTTLSDLIGADTQPWMSTPGRNCDTERLYAKEVQFKADLWFPSDKRETPDMARKLCEGCPALTACFEFAMFRPELEGIYGATTTNERIALRKSIGCGTPNGYARHKRHGEDACRPCKDARAAYVRERNAERKAAA